MQARNLLAATFAAVLLIGTASGATIDTTSVPSGPFERGSSYDVSATAFVDCSEHNDGDTLTLTIANADDIGWINATSVEETLAVPGDCTFTSTINNENVDPGLYYEFSGDFNFTIGQDAPAFDPTDFQPGLAGESNDGGNFTVDVEYDPGFLVPTGLTFDSVAGGATAAIPVTLQANADSVFFFDVTSFTFDGAEAPEGATAHIQDSLEVDSPLASDELAVTKNVELHFGDHSGHEPDDMHGDMDSGDESTDSSDDHVHWETAEAVVEVTLAPAADNTTVSDPQQVTITFTNTDAETLPHQEGEGNDEEEDEGFSIPGYELVAAVAALGMVAALRRRD